MATRLRVDSKSNVVPLRVPLEGSGKDTVKGYYNLVAQTDQGFGVPRRPGK